MHVNPFAAEERSEAAIGGVAVVKPESTIYLKHRTTRLYVCSATDRSLAALLSGYRYLSHTGSSVKRSARKSSMLRSVAGICLREAYTA